MGCLPTLVGVSRPEGLLGFWVFPVKGVFLLPPERLPLKALSGTTALSCYYCVAVGAVAIGGKEKRALLFRIKPPAVCMPEGVVITLDRLFLHFYFAW